MTDLRQLGYEIMKAREAAGMTQAELGEHLGISRASVSLLESGGTVHPRMDRLGMIADLLNIPPTLLYDLAGLKLTAPSSEQLQWLATQLDAEGNDLLVELGLALLRERQRRAVRQASPKGGRPKR